MSGLTGFAGSFGAISADAAVAIVSDESTTEAGIGDGAAVLKASAITVNASDDRTAHSKALGASAGSAAVGASVAKSTIGGGVTARLGNGAQIGQGATTVGSLGVLAASTSHADSYAMAAKAGLGLAAGGAAATSEATPYVSATMGADSEHHTVRCSRHRRQRHRRIDRRGTRRERQRRRLGGCLGRPRHRPAGDQREPRRGCKPHRGEPPGKRSARPAWIGHERRRPCHRSLGRAVGGPQRDRRGSPRRWPRRGWHRRRCDRHHKRRHSHRGGRRKYPARRCQRPVAGIVALGANISTADSVATTTTASTGDKVKLTAGSTAIHAASTSDNLAEATAGGGGGSLGPRLAGQHPRHRHHPRPRRQRPGRRPRAGHRNWRLQPHCRPCKPLQCAGGQYQRLGGGGQRRDGKQRARGRDLGRDRRCGAHQGGQSHGLGGQQRAQALAQRPAYPWLPGVPEWNVSRARAVSSTCPRHAATPPSRSRRWCASETLPASCRPAAPRPRVR